MKKQKYWFATILFVITIVIINILSKSQDFCDWYVENIFPVWTNTMARFSNIFPFSIGEIILALFILWMLFILVCCFIYLRKKLSFLGKLLRATLHFILVVCVILSLNLSLLYSTSKLTNNTKKVDVEQLKLLRNYLLQKCNELSCVVDRDDEGVLICPQDMQNLIVESYQIVGQNYSRLLGYYPKAKTMLGSYFMYQTSTLGVYFPHSLEAIYSKYVSQSCTPFTIAHELAHLKGYIYEDEANYFAYLACITSSDPMIQYSGYLGVVDFVNNDLYKIYLSLQLSETYGVWVGEVYANDYVIKDDVYYDQRTLELLGDQNELIKDVSHSASEAYYDFYQTTMNYNEVTALLLQYYKGKLYN